MQYDSAKSAARPPRTIIALAIAGSIVAAGLSGGHRAELIISRLTENAKSLLGSHKGSPTQAREQDDATALDSREPGVANLDPRLRRALRRASKDAALNGVTITINSGWRSRRHQQRLLDQAVAKYGSVEEAARWVATVVTSPHVAGDAVDLGPARAISWLTEHGAGYGLCQIYHNEPWHFELRPAAVAHGCPARYLDPTHDPRMQP
jgi:hypothetical protein